jgi:hypothetical protein
VNKTKKKAPLGGAIVEEQEVKETDSIVQAESESKEKAKKYFSVWYIALMICVLMVATSLCVHH